MALIQCPKCGGKLSDRAEKCPHCGYPSAVHNTVSHSNNEQQEVSSDKIRTTSRTHHKVLWITLSVVLFVILGIGTYILWMDNAPNAAEETTPTVTEEWQKVTNPYKDGYYKAEWTYKGQWYAVEYELENNAIRSAKFIEQQESHALKCKLAHGEYIKALRPDKSEDDFYFQFSLKNNSGFMKYPTEKDIHVTIYEKRLETSANNTAIAAEVEVVPAEDELEKLKQSEAPTLVGKTYIGFGNSSGLGCDMEINFDSDGVCTCISDWYRAYPSAITTTGNYIVKDNKVTVRCNGETLIFSITDNGSTLSFDNSNAEGMGTASNDYMTLHLQNEMRVAQ